jgi:cell division protein FtsL
MREKSESTQGAGGGVIRQVLALTAVAAMFTAVGLLHVICKVGAVEAGYHLGKLEDAHRILERDNVALKLELATLRSAAHIETTARTTLGMTAPAPQAIFAVGGPVAPIVHTVARTAKRPAHASPPRPTGGKPLALMAPERG